MAAKPEGRPLGLALLCCPRSSSQQFPAVQDTMSQSPRSGCDLGSVLCSQPLLDPGLGGRWTHGALCSRSLSRPDLGKEPAPEKHLESSVRWRQWGRGKVRYTSQRSERAFPVGRRWPCEARGLSSPSERTAGTRPRGWQPWGDPLGKTPLTECRRQGGHQLLQSCKGVHIPHHVLLGTCRGDSANNPGVGRHCRHRGRK